MIKNFLLIPLCLAYCQASLAQAPVYNWAKELGNNANNNYIYPYGMAVDKNDNVFTTGFFQDTADFDPGVGIQQLLGTNGCMFISKLDKYGSYLWAKQLGVKGGAQGEDICVDSKGNCIVVSSFTDTIDTDPGLGVANLNCLTSSNLAQSFILKLDSLGNFMWSKQLNVNSIDSTHSVFALNVTSDTRDNVIVSGYFSGTVDFDPGPLTALRTSNLNGGLSLFILKLDKQGNFINVKTIGNTSVPEAIYSFGITHDKSDNVMVTGSFSGQVDFDPGSSVFNMISTGTRAAFTVCLDSNGLFRWANSVGPDANNGSLFSNFGFGVATDSSGNTFVTGTVQDTVDLDVVNALFPVKCNGPNDAFVVKYDTLGNVAWGHIFGSDGTDIGQGIAIDKLGNVLCTGDFMYTVDFDPSANIDTLSDDFGGGECYITQFDNNGNLNWAINTQGHGNISSNFIAPNQLSGFYISGYFGDTIDFDEGIGVANIFAGNLSTFVCKYINPESPSAITSYPNSENIPIYPNPNSGIFQIDRVNYNAKTYKFSIMNSLGEKIKEGECKSGAYLNISNLASGVYYLQLTSEGKQQALKKIIKY